MRGQSQTYSITSSARASSVGGTSRPSAFAVLRLITSSNFTGYYGPCFVRRCFLPIGVVAAQSAGRVPWQQGLDLIALHHAFGAPNRCIGRKGLRLTQHRDALVVTGRVIAKVLASEWSLKIAQWMDFLTRPEIGRKRGGPGRLTMADFDRRSVLGCDCRAIATPRVASGLEATKITDWMTMSLEARNLAFNNVAHVGPDFARKKTEGWAAASKASASSARSTSIWLMLKESGPSGTCIPPPILRRHASFTSMAVIGSAAARRYLPVSPRVFSRAAGRRRCLATLWPLTRA